MKYSTKYGSITRNNFTWFVKRVLSEEYGITFYVRRDDNPPITWEQAPIDWPTRLVIAALPSLPQWINIDVEDLVGIAWSSKKELGA